MLATDVTMAQHAAMVLASDRHAARAAEIEGEARREIEALSQPIRERAARRIAQLGAMLEDELREAMASKSVRPTP